MDETKPQQIGFAKTRRMINERWAWGAYHPTYARGFAGAVVTHDGKTLKCDHVHKTTTAACKCAAKSWASYTQEF